jgi:excisionase family DNA binding protein
MMYTIKQVAELLQVGKNLVAQFVESGELDAVDVSLNRGTRKRLRIPDDALQRFLDRRRVHVLPSRGRGRRQPRPRDVIDYFAPSRLEAGRRRLKISEVAEYLGITVDHVRQLIAYGHLAAINVGGTGMCNRYRVAEKELVAFIERSKNEPKHSRSARLRGPDFLDTFDGQIRKTRQAGRK